MKKAVLAIGVCGLLAGLAYGGSGWPTERSDNFNDNVRNRAGWKVASYEGRLVETNRRLYYNSVGGSSYPSEIWYWKTPYKLLNGYMLETSILINYPTIPPGPPERMYLGMGFEDFDTLKRIFVKVVNFNYTRMVYVSDGVSSEITFPLPYDISRFYLIMRYNTVTGKLMIWQRAVDNSWKAKVGAVNMNSWWSVPLGTTLTLRSYLTGESHELDITSAAGFFLDNYNIKMIFP